jgi:hypothetical protein
MDQGLTHAVESVKWQGKNAAEGERVTEQVAMEGGQSRDARRPLPAGAWRCRPAVNHVRFVIPCGRSVLATVEQLLVVWR